MERLDDYFSTARERYLIRTRRIAGHARASWTEDRIFKEWRFCNVFREDDRTTVWFRDHIRNKLTGNKLVESTLIFRQFNRIETGEILLDMLLGDWDTEEARRRLDGVKPLVTGAFMIRSPEGMTKLDGLLMWINHSVSQLPKLDAVNGWVGATLQQAWRELLDFPGIGPFMAYEIVTDLRHTPILWNATDVNSWANAGPGATRGAGRVLTNNRRQFKRQRDQDEVLDVMKQLYNLAQQPKYWPFEKWEMREVEHWLCEFEKYCSAEEGHKQKRRFK